MLVFLPIKKPKLRQIALLNKALLLYTPQFIDIFSGLLVIFFLEKLCFNSNLVFLYVSKTAFRWKFFGDTLIESDYLVKIYFREMKRLCYVYVKETSIYHTFREYYIVHNDLYCQNCSKMPAFCSPPRRTFSE